MIAVETHESLYCEVVIRTGSARAPVHRPRDRTAGYLSTNRGGSAGHRTVCCRFQCCRRCSVVSIVGRSQGLLFVAAFLAGVFHPALTNLRCNAIGRSALTAFHVQSGLPPRDGHVPCYRLFYQAFGLLAHGIFRHRRRSRSAHRQFHHSTVPGRKTRLAVFPFAGGCGCLRQSPAMNCRRH